MTQPKKLPSQKELIEIFTYNPVTGDLRRRSRNGIKKPISKTNEAGYKIAQIKAAKFRCHRLIYKIVTGEEPKFIDHINGDRSDNSWGNLRSVTKKENCLNAKIPKNNVSGIIGVRYEAESNYFRVKIGPDELGGFNNIFDAACVRRSEEIKRGYHINHGRLV